MKSPPGGRFDDQSQPAAYQDCKFARTVCHPEHGSVHYIVCEGDPSGVAENKNERRRKMRGGSTMADIPDHSEEKPQRINTSGTGWGFGVLAAVVLLILLSYGFGNNGRWGGRDGIAHMLPPVASSNDGPATRAWRSNTP
jgi:hypothetical protein